MVIEREREKEGKRKGERKRVKLIIVLYYVIDYQTLILTTCACIHVNYM